MKGQGQCQSISSTPAQQHVVEWPFPYNHTGDIATNRSGPPWRPSSPVETAISPSIFLWRGVGWTCVMLNARYHGVIGTRCWCWAYYDVWLLYQRLSENDCEFVEHTLKTMTMYSGYYGTCSGTTLYNTVSKSLYEQCADIDITDITVTQYFIFIIIIILFGLWT